MMARHDSLTGEIFQGWVLWFPPVEANREIQAQVYFFGDLEVAKTQGYPYDPPEYATQYVWSRALMGYFWAYPTELAAQMSLRKGLYLTKKLYGNHMGRLNEMLHGCNVVYRALAKGKYNAYLPPDGRWWFDFTDYTVNRVYPDQMVPHRWHNEGDGTGRRVVSSYLLYIADNCLGEIKTDELFDNKQECLRRAHSMTTEVIRYLKVLIELTEMRISQLKREGARL